MRVYLNCSSCSGQYVRATWPKPSQTVDTFVAILIERKQYREGSELVNPTLLATISSLCGPLPCLFLDREELSMSSLDIKIFLTGHKEFLKIEKRDYIVRRYLTGPTGRGLIVHGVQE